MSILLWEHLEWAISKLLYHGTASSCSDVFCDYMSQWRIMWKNNKHHECVLAENWLKVGWNHQVQSTKQCLAVLHMYVVCLAYFVLCVLWMCCVYLVMHLCVLCVYYVYVSGLYKRGRLAWWFLQHWRKGIPTATTSMVLTVSWALVSVLCI